MKASTATSKREQMRRNLLKKPIKSVADLKSGETLNLSPVKSRVHAKRLSTELRLSQALQPLKGVLRGDKRPWPYR